MPDFIFLISGVALAWALTGLAVRLLSARRLVTDANERSLHEGPVPIGGGLAIMAVVALLWPLGPWTFERPQAMVLGAAILLSLTHWINDIKSLWRVTRLALQALAVGVALSILPDTLQFFPDFPIAVERVLLGLGWIWFINLFNFMDGIDGLAGGEAVAIVAGYVAVMGLTRQSSPGIMLAIAIGAGCLGYLIWNWHPAKIFMGDAGSIPLGFLLGFLLLDLAAHGQIAAAIILPLVFVCDATLTLLRRFLTGKTISQPHREHYYQRAILGGQSHDAVTLRAMATNAGLVICALLSIRAPVMALIGAGVLVAILLLSLSHSAQTQLKADGV